jgi:hypothetical protein
LKVHALERFEDDEKREGVAEDCVVLLLSLREPFLLMANGCAT